MPHIVLETTSDLPENAHIPDILEALVVELAGNAGIPMSSTKAYHALRSVWAVGEGHPPGIAHCTVKLLGGEPAAKRTAIADGVYRVLRQQFAESLDAGEVVVSLEVREMDRETYRF